MAENTQPDYLTMIAKMNREQTMAQEIALVPDKVLDHYQEKLDAQSAQIADLVRGMNELTRYVMAKPGAFANQTAVIPTTPVVQIGIPKIQDIPTTVSTPIVIPKVSVPTTATGEKMAPADFYRFLITEKKKHNTPYTKGKKTYPASKGVHTVISGFNQDVKDYYGKDTDVVKLTTMLSQQGIIVVQVARKGPLVFLPEDYTSGGYIQL